MSGGSLDYVCYGVEDAAVKVMNASTSPLHMAFAQHLTKVGKALHAMEWMLSGDT